MSEKSASSKDGRRRIGAFANTFAWRGAGTAGEPSARPRSVIATVCGAVGVTHMKKGLLERRPWRMTFTARSARTSVW